MKYIYNLLGLTILCEIPFELTITDESSPFILKDINEDCVDVIFSFQEVISLEHSNLNGYWKNNRYYINNNTVYFHPINSQDAYAKVDIEEVYKMNCKYVKGKEKTLCFSNYICNLMCLEMLLLNHHGLLLHSSFIKWNNQGILFSAPSGVGKSTQASLWEQYEGAEIINGDRAGIRFIDGQWNVYGLPYAGSSGIYRNEKAPLKAIVVLKQGKENHICRLTASEAMRYLYPEFSIHRWDKNFTNKAISYIMELLMKIPVYMLECRPDQDAVKLTKQKLLENK